MYENESTSYGFKMRFGGYIDLDEMEEWANEVQQGIDRTPSEWHCYVDMRPLDSMSEEGQQLMSDVKAQCHENGLTRVATLVESPTVRLQFEQMSEGTGGDQERYLDAQSTDDPEQTAIEWVQDGIDPEG